MNCLHKQRPHEAKRPGIVAKPFQSPPMHRTNTIPLCPMSSRRKMAPGPAIHLPPWLWLMCRRVNCIFHLAPECAASRNISLPPFPHNYVPLSSNMPSISTANDLLRRTDAVVSNVLLLVRAPQALSPEHIPMQMSDIKRTNLIIIQLVREWHGRKWKRRKLLEWHHRLCCLSSTQENRQANQLLCPANRVQSFQVPCKPDWQPIQIDKKT